MPTIDTPFGTKLHYAKHGSGPGLMLLHGFPERGTIWNNVLPTLEQHFTLLIPDLPGAGESTLNGEQSLDEMAIAVKGMLEREDTESVVIVGHSMGGYTALAFARQFPHMVNGLCLVHSTASADDEEKKKMRAKAIEIILNGGKEAFLKQMTAGLFAEGFRKENPEVIAEQERRANTMEVASLVNFYKAIMNRPSHEDALARFNFPLQYILGEADSVIPVEKILPQVHVAPVSFVSLYERCGHMSMLENPEKLSADLYAFATYCNSK